MGLEIPKSINIGVPVQIKNSRNILIEGGLLIVVCFLFTWYLILPKKAEVDARGLLLNKFVEEQNKMDDNLTTINKLIADIKSHKTDLVKLDDAIPLEGKPLNLQILIQKLADSAGVKVGDINVAGKTGVVAGDTELLKNPFGVTRAVQTLSGTVFVFGKLSELEIFLNKIETSGRVIQVSDVEIQGGQDGNLTLRIVIEAYYLAPIP